MKNITKIVAFFLLVCLCLPLFSCSEEIDLGEPECVMASMNQIIYDDILYYYVNGNPYIKYCNLNAIEDGSYPLYNDTVAVESENPFYTIGGSLFAVDPWLTQKNGGEHVLIFADRYSDPETEADYVRIVSFNTGTQELQLIADELPSPLLSMLIYGETIILAANDGELGTTIYRVDTDGENVVKMDNSRRRTLYVDFVYDNRVYYLDGSIYYSNSLDFDDPKKEFSAYSMFSAFPVGGDVIYASKSTNVSFGDRNYPSLTICRKPIAGADDGEKEEIISNVYGGTARGDKFYYSTTEPRYVTETKIVSRAKYYEYSFETNTARELFDLTGTPKARSIIAVGENFLLFSEIDYSTGDTPQTRTDTTIVLNLATGEETVLREE